MACRKSKVRCVWESDANGSSTQSVVSALQDLTEMTNGGFGDVFTALREVNGTLNDILKVKTAQLRLEHGDAGAAEVKKILKSRQKRKDQWAEQDKAQEDKGEGTSKEK
jgi:hypothetical protein